MVLSVFWALTWLAASLQSDARGSCCRYWGLPPHPLLGSGTQSSQKVASLSILCKDGLGEQPTAKWWIATDCIGSSAMKATKATKCASSLTTGGSSQAGTWAPIRHLRREALSDADPFHLMKWGKMGFELSPITSTKCDCANRSVT